MGKKITRREFVKGAAGAAVVAGAGIFASCQPAEVTVSGPTVTKTVTVTPSSGSAPVSGKLSVINMAGTPAAQIQRIPLVPRLSSLDGKTVYLVDENFTQTVNLFPQIEKWFAQNMPKVTLKYARLKGRWGTSDPDLEALMGKEADAVINGAGG